MKKTILIALLAASASLSAQTPASYECIYEYDVNGTTDKGSLSERYNCMLQIGEAESRFVDYATYQLDSVSAIPGIDKETIGEFEKRERCATPYFDREVRFAPASSELTMQGLIGVNFGKYEEKAPVADWKLTDGTETVCGYECMKATGSYGGREWRVWFTEEIPAPYGPWKFAGLPGLVMKAEDSEGIHRFTAIAFRQASVDIPADSRPNVLKMDRQKFEQKKNAFDSNHFGSLSPSDIESFAVTSEGQVVVNGHIFRDRENGFIPLEKWDDGDNSGKNRRSKGNGIIVVETGSQRM